jgi:DNA-directed DNA polymerase
MKTLVIIDGKSVFYRGYYAMGNLSTAEGVPTSGVYGFATIAMEIVKKLKPNKVVVAWDKAHTSTAKRLAIYPEYKAGRVKPPEDFYAQIPYLKELISALGWDFLEADEYEADDIIGTLARQADEKHDYMTYIVSSDLDMLQIVDENTKMYRLLKGFSNIEEMDIQAIEEKYGILKSQFLDLKALKGDNSDNIPGVPGIGEKTAVKLLSQYGDIQGIYDHIEEITGSTQKKLIEGKDSVLMSYRLAKIMTDAPVDLDKIPELVIDQDRIVAALKKLEFNSLIRKFRAEFENKESLADPEVLEDENIVLKYPIPDKMVVMADIKEKMHASEELAEAILLDNRDFFDIKQAEFLINPLRRIEAEPKQVSLLADETCERALSGEYDDTEKIEYAKVMSELHGQPKLMDILNKFDLPLIPVLYKMEKCGVKIDLEYFAELKREFTERVSELEQKIYSATGVCFNVNSPIQLSKVLFEDLNLPTKGIKKTSRGFSTGASELEKLEGAHPVIELIKDYREDSKLLSTYVLPLPDLVEGDGRIHTTFTQDVTATGRLSSVNPNLQNIPVRSEDGKRIRTGFVAREGRTLVSADYAQFELRLAAVLAGDEKLIEAFSENVDIHTKTAAEVFNIPMEQVTKSQRRAAKIINFGVMYGMSPKGLSDAADMSFMEAKQFIDDYFKVRQPIKNYLDRTLEQARNLGYVETFFGRKRPTPDVKSANYIVRTAAERAAQNMPIQGTEADLMKRAMIQVDKMLSTKFMGRADLVLQIHDSLIIECDNEVQDEVAKGLVEIMEGVAPELPIRLKADVSVGENWGEL